MFLVFPTADPQKVKQATPGYIDYDEASKLLGVFSDIKTEKASFMGSLYRFKKDAYTPLTPIPYKVPLGMAATRLAKEISIDGVLLSLREGDGLKGYSYIMSYQDTFNLVLALKGHLSDFVKDPLSIFSTFEAFLPLFISPK